MPTIITHPAVPLALGLALGRGLISTRLMWAGVAASVIPDLDVIGFRFGIAYGDAWGHRGATHSLFFAAALGCAATMARRWFRAPAWLCFVFVALCAASHGLLDILTNGGLGVALFWPFSETRYFFPVRIIEVSPLSIRGVIGERGFSVFGSELLWVWLPAIGLAILSRFIRHKRAT